ncbi:MAG: MarR family transcriptional regulator [Candidatus Limiplasma sp.]|nr:MarR family transcriptional regulator [Candidatus Limiplasma sp.]
MFQTSAYYLSVLYKDFYAYAGARLHPLGLNNGLVFFIIYVGKHPGCTPSEMTKALHADWGHSQRCITRLVDEGFLTKDKEGRSYHLHLTETGRQVFEVSHQLFYDWDKQKLSELTEAERKTLLDLLHKITRKGDEPR